MSENPLTIASHKGPYCVSFGAPFAGLENGLGEKEHLIIDAKVAELYSGVLLRALAGPNVLKIGAVEKNKAGRCFGGGRRWDYRGYCGLYRRCFVSGNAVALLSNNPFGAGRQLYRFQIVDQRRRL